jgi:hypothetical protein
MLLVVMLIGLLRMRRETSGGSHLGHFLWRQVRLCLFSPAVIPPDSLMRISVHQGLIWLLLATIAEVPTVVCLVILLNCSFSLIAISHLRCLCF